MPDHLAGSYDVMVLGTGPAGEGAAMKCAKAGKKVAAVERFNYVGGGCTHWGTIPSKALRRAIYRANVTFDNPIYRRMDVAPDYNFPDLLATANQVIDEQTELRQSFYDHNRIRLIPGEASFIDPHTIEILKADDARERYHAEAFVIATGSRPWQPSGIDFSHRRIRDSDSILKMDFTPRSIVIYGAGVIGCEYASMFARMKMDVTLVNTRDRLLSFLDHEIIAALSYHFADMGIRILHNEEFESIAGHDDHAELRLKSGKCEKADVVLWANGRSGNSDLLNLQNIGVTPNKRGQIEVNELLQVKHTPADGAGKARPGDTSPKPTPLSTSSSAVHEHILAAGDIIGQPGLASASYDQGRFAGTVLVEDGAPDWHLIHDIPTGIYTSPEISSLGKTEEQLTADAVPYEVGKAQFKHLARAQITHIRTGMLKLCFRRDTLELLGIHCFGENAAEIIHIGQAIMSQPAPHNSLHYFTRTTFNYPTMAEAYRVAALNGLDRL